MTTNPHRGSDFTKFLIEQGLTNTDQPMTPTPRTNALELENIGLAWGDAQDAVLSLARELERELAAERALADRLAGEVAACKTTFGLHVGGPAEALDAWKEARRGTD